MMKQRSFKCLFLCLIGVFLFCGARPLFGQAGNLFSQLIEASKSEIAKKEGKVSIALEWVNPKQGKPVVDEFKKEFPFIKEASFQTLGSSANERHQRTLMEYKAGRLPDIDIMPTSSEIWNEFRQAGIFVKPPFPYEEMIKSLPKSWIVPHPKIVDPNGYFIAATELTRGIAYNKNVVPPNVAPKSWEDCLNPMWKGKVLDDPRPKLTALQHDPQTREAHLKWLKGLVENKVVLNRGITENLEKVAAGEFPLNCGTDYQNAMPMIEEGAPMTFVFPYPFPLEFGTQIFVLKWSKTPATTELFALWLATKGQPYVEKYGYRGFPWDQTSRKYSLVKGKHVAICDVDCLLKKDQYIFEHAEILNLPGTR